MVELGMTHWEGSGISYKRERCMLATVMGLALC